MKIMSVTRQIRETYKDPHSEIIRREQFLTNLGESIVITLERLCGQDSLIEGKDSYIVATYHTEGDDFWAAKKPASFETALTATLQYHQSVGEARAKAGRHAA